MTRPVTHDDLPDYQREGHRVAVVVPEYVVKYPSLGQHLLAALAEADRLGLDVADGVVTLPRTVEELDTALASAQRSWDHMAERYENPADVTGIWRRLTDEWAAAEGRDPIDWDAVDAARANVEVPC